jgi:hypothetical protein
MKSMWPIFSPKRCARRLANSHAQLEKAHGRNGRRAKGRTGDRHRADGI